MAWRRCSCSEIKRPSLTTCDSTTKPGNFTLVTLGIRLYRISSSVKNVQGFGYALASGMDHAGIATQAKSMRLAEDGISRYDLGRENSWESSEWKDVNISDDYRRTKMGSSDYLVSVSPWRRSIASPWRLRAFTRRAGFTRRNLLSTGIQKLVQPFLISRLFTRMWKVPSTTWTTC